ncbi:hypothetical protein [Trebonia sp.]|nr:hypothetical protein [Trebonia sp.]
MTEDPDGATAGAGTPAVRPGWQGRFYEDFQVGDVYQHPATCCAPS